MANNVNIWPITATQRRGRWRGCLKALQALSLNFLCKYQESVAFLWWSRPEIWSSLRVLRPRAIVSWFFLAATFRWQTKYWFIVSLALRFDKYSRHILVWKFCKGLGWLHLTYLLTQMPKLGKLWLVFNRLMVGLLFDLHRRDLSLPYLGGLLSSFSSSLLLLICKHFVMFWGTYATYSKS